MVDLRAKPFYLNETEIRWVEDTIASMDLDEKLSQLFVLLKGVPGVNEEQIKALMESARPGGMRWQGGDKESVARQNALFQKYSRIPVFVAGNCDDGGCGVLPKEGTFVATAAEAGASEGVETAYRIGFVAGREASAVGVNWMFNPVADVYKNWRNTIVNTRSFGSDPGKVTDCVRAYIRGVKDANPNMACTCKHFPGDGWDELDPHNSPAFNGATVEEWMDSYGKVYRTMIDEGLEAVMTGQISFPAWSRRARPGIRDSELMPASLAPELLNGLLREELGFNGLIISDASHMIGMSGVMARRDAVPKCIAAGCDMFLFANDFEEDLGYLRAGVEQGTQLRIVLRGQFLAARAAERAEFCVFERTGGGVAEEFCVARIGPRPAAFDVCHAKFVQFRGNTELIVLRERDMFSLGAVAKRGIVYENVLVWHSVFFLVKETI